MGGGDFGASFASAFIGKLAGPVASKLEKAMPGAGYVASALIGGTTSKIAGGKFANGAITGMMMFAVNDLQQNKSRRSQTPKKPKPDIDAGDKVIGVGGLLDDWVGPVKGLYEEKFFNEYVEWHDVSDRLPELVGQYEGRVTVVAHSWGADETMNLVADGMQVHQLITVDAVGWTRPDLQAVANNAVIWTNLDSTGTLFSSPADFIGTVGRSYNNAPLGYADNFYRSNANHAVICGIYCNPANHSFQPVSGFDIWRVDP
ncbi:hypothetical protein [Ostreibacterium oceani]|uniref:Uncharacterized protein n=1 Tax=Ostreibacterium oceani TaxID=2654998 RepID=A0A6N7ESN0_9GAMM|nr:hypothetical protein [Ostreibacterium oceani]MPV85502.1 hypothetical protein [Ostreibacterium oceani]